MIAEYQIDVDRDIKQFESRKEIYRPMHYSIGLAETLAFDFIEGDTVKVFRYLNPPKSYILNVMDLKVASWEQRMQLMFSIAKRLANEDSFRNTDYFNSFRRMTAFLYSDRL